MSDFRQQPRIPMTERRSATWLEGAQVQAKGGRVLYHSDDDPSQKHAIPYVNLAVLFLGSRSSISTEATQLLAKEGTQVVMTAAGRMPVFLNGIEQRSSADTLNDLLPGCLNHWYAMEMMKITMAHRVDRMGSIGTKLSKRRLPMIRDRAPFAKNGASLKTKLEGADCFRDLLQAEADYSQGLHAAFGRYVGIKDFKRTPRAQGDDRMAIVNGLIDRGSDICLGISGAALSSMGISPDLPVIHEGSRPKGLSFDLAAAVEDAFILPLAFSIGRKAKSRCEAEAQFQSELLDQFDDQNILKILFETIHAICEVCEK